MKLGVIPWHLIRFWLNAFIPDSVCVWCVSLEQGERSKRETSFVRSSRRRRDYECCVPLLSYYGVLPCAIHRLGLGSGGGARPPPTERANALAGYAEGSRALHRKGPKDAGSVSYQAMQGE